MSYEPILIVAGEPNSVFFEIFFKSIKVKKFKSPLILIASKNILDLQMKKLKFKKRIKIIELKNIKNQKIDNSCINIINVSFSQKKAFEKISYKSNNYIHKSFKVAFDLIDKGISHKLINGPISKKTFLKNKYLGVTEYLSKKSNNKTNAMLIFNKRLSVCPLTTHLPLSKVAKQITKKLIKDKVKLIDNFYKSHLGYIPKVAITGLNPHCESINKFNEDEKIVRPAIKNLLNSGFKVSGPHSADTIFLKKNRKNFDVVIGMYHDQVLTPIKTLFEYDAINITLGLPFLRVSPDHGPNEKMIGKNKSDPLSLIKSINFLDKN